MLCRKNKYVSFLGSCCEKVNFMYHGDSQTNRRTYHSSYNKSFCCWLSDSDHLVLCERILHRYNICLFAPMKQCERWKLSEQWQSDSFLLPVHNGGFLACARWTLNCISWLTSGSLCFLSEPLGIIHVILSIFSALTLWFRPDHGVGQLCGRTLRAWVSE